MAKMWNPSEEQTLVDSVGRNKNEKGFIDWKIVEADVGRKANACAQRWHIRKHRPLPPPTAQLKALKARKIVSPGNRNIGNGKAPAAPGVLGTTLAFSFCPNCGCNLARVNHALAAVHLIERRVRS